ncbi:hypothetical protein VNO78_14763 [Psophocarpus tetragonolobus]|uniref:C2H2-type domain-containing protein n=1 Tax=Psophocarpus tetragonolobus TaxID=3891 RepID=A0AAN9XJ75_PSOTE
MANCLMMLSRGGGGGGGGGGEFEGSYASSSRRVFECKTCNRQFPSFQALGGHRASHKKPRLMAAADIDGHGQGQLLHDSPPKPKTHECSICGLEFAIGQALGGHMRRHRAANLNANLHTTTTSFHSSPNNKPPHKRSLFVFDLNLTPFENDLEFFNIPKPTTFVDYFY